MLRRLLQQSKRRLPRIRLLRWWRQWRFPIRFSESPIQYDRAPPLLGQHTAEVLEEILGLKESEIVALKASGAIG